MGLLWSLDLPAIILFIVDTVHAIRFLTSAQRGDEVLVVWSSMDTDQNEFDLWFGDCDHGEQFRSRVRSNVDAFNSGEGGLVVFYLPREVSSFDLLVTCRIIAVAVGCDPSSSPALDSLLLSIEPPVSSASSRTTFTIGHFSIFSSSANPVARTSLLQSTSTTTVVITFNTIPVQTSVSISGSTQSILSNLSPLRPTSSTRMQSNNIPGGAIAGGVIGALVALGALIIFLVFLRRRRRFTSSLIPVPLPYDVNYVQPLEKRNQITRKKEAVEQRHDELQAEEVHPRNAHGGPLQLATNEMFSGGVQAEQEFEILWRRIIELKEQQRILENQQSSLPLPPGYSI